MTLRVTSGAASRVTLEATSGAVGFVVRARVIVI